MRVLQRSLGGFTAVGDLAELFEALAFRLIRLNEGGDLRMKGVLRGVESANRFGKLSLLQFFFDRQTKFGQRLDVGAGMKFQILELGENCQRLFQITGLLLYLEGFHLLWRWDGFNLLILDRTWGFLSFPRLDLRLEMMFLLRNLLGVGDVSGI